MYFNRNKCLNFHLIKFCVVSLVIFNLNTFFTRILPDNTLVFIKNSTIDYNFLKNAKIDYKLENTESFVPGTKLRKLILVETYKSNKLFNILNVNLALKQNNLFICI